MKGKISGKGYKQVEIVFSKIFAPNRSKHNAKLKAMQIVFRYSYNPYILTELWINIAPEVQKQKIQPWLKSQGIFCV